MTFTWSPEDDQVVKYARALAADAAGHRGRGGVMLGPYAAFIVSSYAAVALVVLKRQ